MPRVNWSVKHGTCLIPLGWEVDFWCAFCCKIDCMRQQLPCPWAVVKSYQSFLVGKTKVHLSNQTKKQKNEVLLGCSRKLVKGKWAIIYFLEHPSTYMLSMANPLLGCVYLRSKYHKFSTSKTTMTAASILENEKVMENHRFFRMTP